MCRRKAGEWINRKRARSDRKGEEVSLFLLGYPAEVSAEEREEGWSVCVCVWAGGGGRATVSIDLVSDYRFISRCLLDVITQFDVAEIAREHQRKG